VIAENSVQILRVPWTRSWLEAIAHSYAEALGPNTHPRRFSLVDVGTDGVTIETPDQPQQ